MNAPKYITASLESERYLQRSLELHQKRLKEISGKVLKNFSDYSGAKLKKRKNFVSGKG